MEEKIPYYEDNSRISNSNIGWYINKGPAFLKKMLDGEQGIALPQMKKGSAIHEWILQNSIFWDDYVIRSYEIPKSAQQKKICEDFVSFDDVELINNENLAKIKIYRNNYKADKISDEKCLSIINSILEEYKDYISFLKDDKSNKINITFSEYNDLKKIEENVKKHKKANELLYDFQDTFETHNEFHINWEFPLDNGNQIKCKSLLDRVMIDRKNKKIILIDIKTTGDTFDFKHSINEYDYYRQLSYYWMAIHYYMMIELKESLDDYVYESYIICIQNNNDYNVRVFKIDPYSIEERIPVIKDTLNKIAWHIDNNLWDNTIEYYSGDGSESI